jgi:hypothetical protein
MLYLLRSLLLLEDIPQQLPGRFQVTSAQVLQEVLQLGVLTHLAAEP